MNLVSDLHDSVESTHAPEQPRDEEAPFRYFYSTGFAHTLEQLGATLFVSTYQAGKLCAFRARGGKMAMLPRTFDKVMGVAVDPMRMAVGTRYQIWTMRNESILAPRIKPENTYDACYLPRSSHVTSNIDIHEIAWGGEQLWVVNTLFSCLCTPDPDFSFVPRWHPPFVSKLSRQDRCHLNGLAVAEGRPAYVTAFGETDEPEGWRAGKVDGGIIIHVDSGETVARGLSMPHSPRVYAGKLWALDSGNGTLVTVDADRGHIERVAAFNGYTRGLAFCGRFAFVGLSKVREKRIFGGVPISEPSQQRQCGVSMVDITTGRVVDQLTFESTVDEIFDVQILPGIRYPTVIGFGKDEIQRASVIAPLKPID
ncbi:MAG: TIGR03032 family protein, partial [Pirellulales bacterium]|nr:TIGR03032 family protein [Pirellulales bacterium]